MKIRGCIMKSAWRTNTGWTLWAPTTRIGLKLRPSSKRIGRTLTIGPRLSLPWSQRAADLHATDDRVFVFGPFNLYRWLTNGAKIPT